MCIFCQVQKQLKRFITLYTLPYLVFFIKGYFLSPYKSRVHISHMKVPLRKHGQKRETYGICERAPNLFSFM